jgi:hypothetical protein
MTIRSIASVGLCAVAIATQVTGAPRRVPGTIKSLESNTPAVEASFNPKELSVDKTVPWDTDPASTESAPAVQFAGPGATALQVLLTLEDTSDVRSQVESLMQLARVDDALKRPPRVTFTWGAAHQFEGVIESLSQKYTLFLTDGTPVRATVRLRIREAKSASTRRSCQTTEDCPEGYVCVGSACQRR